MRHPCLAPTRKHYNSIITRSPNYYPVSSAAHVHSHKTDYQQVAISQFYYRY